MDCCFPALIQTCEICYSPCSIFEIKVINDDVSICKDCYVKIGKAALNPENKNATKYNEKCKWYSKNNVYSMRGPYVLDKWGQIVGDIVQNEVIMRTFFLEVCFLCKGQVSIFKEVYISGYLYHYECSKLCIL